MKTKLIFNKEAKDKLLNGVRIMSEAVSTTLGPRGQNVAIAKADRYGNIYERIVLHDGVSVAKAIDLEDEFENMGAQLLKQAAQKQVQDVGDGTTVTIILARALLEEINTLVNSGINPMQLRSVLEMYLKQLTSRIRDNSTPVTTYEQKKYIATISAEDKELGELVAKTIEDMGADGLVVTEESKNSQTTVTKQDGLQLDKGFAHPYFQTNPDRGEAVIENPHLLITDRDINSLENIRELIIHFAKTGDKLVIITPNIGQDALASLIENKLKGVLSSLVIKAPGFGKNQIDILQDIAIVTGARFITGVAGHKLEDVRVEDLGRSEYISCNKSETLIVGGKGNKVSERIKEIQQAIKTESQEFDKEKLKERLAKLTSGIAVIRAGGATEVEMKERLERIKDAVAATKAAVTYGIVPGGELIYLLIRENLPKGRDEIETTVRTLLYKVLAEPFKKLLGNAGLDSGQYFERLKGTTKEYGVDINDGEVKDMIKSGIVDPTLVSINSLTNALSVAIQISSTACVIVPIKNETLPELPQE